MEAPRPPVASDVGRGPLAKRTHHLPARVVAVVPFGGSAREGAEDPAPNRAGARVRPAQAVCAPLSGGRMAGGRSEFWVN
ncbi:hypothetical protein GCM10022284_33530 [Streptomyces hundungensis]